MQIKWDSNTTLGIMIGAAVGLTIAYLIFRNRTTTQSVSNLNGLSIWKPLDNIPTTENPSSYIDLENQFQNNQLSPTNSTAYKNNEKKIVRRNSEGFIESVETVRYAKIA